MLLNKREKVGEEYFKNQKVFIECSSNRKNIYPNIHDYSLAKKLKVLMAIDDMIADRVSNKYLEPINTHLLIHG